MFVSKVFVVIIVCYVFFVIFKFLKRRIRFLIIYFVSFVSQEGSDTVLTTFMLGMCLSTSSEIPLVMFDS